VMAYRASESWEEIARVVGSSSPPVARLEVVRQQLAMALNRCGRGSEAERTLRELVAERPSSETYGLLGRIYRDRWASATSAAQKRGLLREAIRAYLSGFEEDFRDPYPGVNAVTLMAVAEPPDPRLEGLLPIVRYSVDRRLAGGRREPDYWDHATDLGLAVLEGDRARFDQALGCCLAAARDSFALSTTADGLELVQAARERRGEEADWIAAAVRELRDARPA
jgi:MAP3K TRAFs-binding domain